MAIAWDRIRIEFHEVGRSRWPRGVATIPAWIDDPVVRDYDLWFIWAGAAGRLRRGWQSIETGTCLWLRPGWEYQFEQDMADPLGMNFIHFALTPSVPAGELPPERITPRDARFVDVALRRIVELFYGFECGDYVRPPARHPDYGLATTIMESVLRELEAAERRAAHPPARGFSDAEERLAQQVALRIAESPQDAYYVADLAKQVGCSRSQLAHVFKKVTGQSPQRYVVQVRIDHARRLLRGTAMKIREIAAAVGYSDIYFFSRQFRQYTGSSPLAFRAQAAADKGRGGNRSR